MRYNPPTNGDLNNPDRSYVNADPANGISGSYPSAQAIEYPQREILRVITDAGLVPSDADLTQLSTAIKALVAAGASPAALFKNVISGLTVGNNAADNVNDIDIAPGSAVADDLSKFIRLTIPLTKRLDANWSAGNNGGGLDTGVKAANTTYHLFLIHNPTDGSTDVIFSASLSSPLLPAGFTKKRRIASLSTNSSSGFIGFVQIGSEFRFTAPTLDVTTNSLSTAAVLYALPTPNSIKVKAIMDIYARRSTTDVWILVSDPDLNFGAIHGSQPAAAPYANIGVTGAGSVDGKISTQLYVFTNTSRQVRAISAASSTDFRISTQAYIDDRRI